MHVAVPVTIDRSFDPGNWAIRGTLESSLITYQMASWPILGLRLAKSPLAQTLRVSACPTRGVRKAKTPLVFIPQMLDCETYVGLTNSPNMNSVYTCILYRKITSVSRGFGTTYLKVCNAAGSSSSMSASSTATLASSDVSLILSQSSSSLASSTTSAKSSQNLSSASSGSIVSLSSTVLSTSLSMVNRIVAK